MVNLNNSGDKQKAIFTLAEKALTEINAYVFRFTHVTTGELVEFTLQLTDDTSTSQTRYNKFEIGTYFQDKTPGQWKYRVLYGIEREEDPGTELETGSMILTGVPVSFTGQEITLTTTGYNG
jgi:hypothetical protein